MSQSYASAGIPLDPEWRTDWTPSYTNFTPGNGTVMARFAKSGLVVAQFQIEFGTTTTVDGSNPTVSLPLTAADNFADLTRTNLSGGIADESGGSTFPLVVRLETTTSMSASVLRADATYLSLNNITATVPFTWGTDDIWFLQAIYEPA